MTLSEFEELLRDFADVAHSAATGIGSSGHYDTVQGEILAAYSAILARAESAEATVAALTARVAELEARSAKIDAALLRFLPVDGSGLLAMVENASSPEVCRILADAKKAAK